jgi:hypothetical protein
LKADGTDEGGKATLILGLEMNEINDHKPRPSYLFMSLPKLGQLTFVWNEAVGAVSCCLSPNK